MSPDGPLRADSSPGEVGTQDVDQGVASREARERILDAAEALFAADVAVLLHQANSQRFDGTVPDLGATVEIVSGALLA